MLTYWYYALRSESNARIKLLHDQYRETVRIASTRISFTCSDGWKDVYVNGHNNDHEIFHNDPVFYAVLPESKVPRDINNAEAAARANTATTLFLTWNPCIGRKAEFVKRQKPLEQFHTQKKVPTLNVDHNPKVERKE